MNKLKKFIEWLHKEMGGFPFYLIIGMPSVVLALYFTMKFLTFIGNLFNLNQL